MLTRLAVTEMGSHRATAMCALTPELCIISSQKRPAFPVDTAETGI